MCVYVKLLNDFTHILSIFLILFPSHDIRQEQKDFQESTTDIQIKDGTKQNQVNG